MSEHTFTHKDLSKALGLSETTIKSYRRKFPGCIPVANQGKPIRFTADALRVATRIRDLFETGMSIEEVRLRLSAEFEWISPDAPEPAADQPGQDRASVREGTKADLGPEITMGVSNMAKSMVALTQQQKTMLTRMQGIESMLEELGLAGVMEKSGALAGSSAKAAAERDALLDARLDQLDENTRELALRVQELAGQLEQFLGRRSKAAAEWRSADTIAEAAQLSAQIMHAAAPLEIPAGDEAPQENATVIPLRPDPMNDMHTERQPAAQDQEPPRSMFGMPLVVRMEEGRYASAGGRSRGRFCLNDLKAMLIYGFMPPNHFSLRWERHGQGWWLFLEQEQGERSIHLLLMEIPAARGGNVVEVLQVIQDGNTLHPVEICGIIDSFAS